MSEKLIPVVVAAALLAYFGAAIVHTYGRSRRMIGRWAADNGFSLERCEWHGSVAWIWSVRVVDAGGRTRDGWVCCGSPLIGVLSDRAEVRWAAPGKSAFR